MEVEDMIVALDKGRAPRAGGDAGLGLGRQTRSGLHLLTSLRTAELTGTPHAVRKVLTFMAKRLELRSKAEESLKGARAH